MIIARGTAACSNNRVQVMGRIVYCTDFKNYVAPASDSRPYATQLPFTTLLKPNPIVKYKIHQKLS